MNLTEPGRQPSHPPALVVFSLLEHSRVGRSWVQTQVSGEILGRAATVMKSLLVASQPIAAVLFGYLAGVASIGPLFIDVGIALIAVTSLLYIPFAELRRAKY